MEDFLFILVGIVWLIYSLYNSKQKAQRKQAEKQSANRPAAPAPAPRRSFLEEMLDPQPPVVRPLTEAEESWEDETAYPEKEAGVTLAEAQSLENIEDEYPESYFEQQYANMYRDREPERMQQFNETTETKEEEIIDEEFDLRKAVVYAEILNPRYI